MKYTSEIHARLDRFVSGLYPSWHETESVNEVVKMLLDEITRCHTELARLQQESRWIPVSERLPESNKRVEFFGGFEQTTHIGYYREHATQWESENGGFWHGRNFALVTHWRPLPQAPEEG